MEKGYQSEYLLKSNDDNYRVELSGYFNFWNYIKKISGNLEDFNEKRCGFLERLEYKKGGFLHNYLTNVAGFFYSNTNDELFIGSSPRLEQSSLKGVLDRKLVIKPFWANSLFKRIGIGLEVICEGKRSVNGEPLNEIEMFDLLDMKRAIETGKLV